MIHANTVFATIVSRVSARLLATLQQIDPLITGVHYQYGHISQIKERLKSVSPYDKYPLVAVLEDERETVSSDGYDAVMSKRILIIDQRGAADTVRNRTRVQRQDVVFTPVLIPIYEELILQIFRSGNFNVYDPAQISHDRFFRSDFGNGAKYGNDKSIMDEPVDAIEMANLKLQTYFENCLK